MNILRCEFDSIKFTQDKIFNTYALGSFAFGLELPELEYFPNCGREPEAYIYYVTVLEAPSGVDVDKLYYFNQDFGRITFPSLLILALKD